MASADEFLRAGDLDGARQALIETVKRAPDDQPARMFLFQLLALSGEWDKASTHLRTLASLSPEAQMLATVYNQAIAAEKQRAEVFAGRAAPTALVSGSPWFDDLIAAFTAFTQGRPTEGEERRDAAFAAAPDTPGTVNDEAFDWIADADSRFGPSFEAIIAGRWGLVPFEAVTQIKCDGPQDLRDVIWLPVEIGMRSGQSVVGFIPARYPGSEASEDTEIRLGRKTDWIEGSAGQQGLGQRLWTVSDGDDLGLLSLRRLVFT